MKPFLFLVAISLSSLLAAQSFPQKWLGTWEGNVVVLSLTDTLYNIPMQLEISETDTAGQWNWIITYGEGEKADIRPYVLIARDSLRTRFVLDERNSIKLDQYCIGSRMFCRFSVDSTLLTVIYTLEGDELHGEIWTGKTRTRRTGESLPESEADYAILRYPFSSVQLSTLYRQP